MPPESGPICLNRRNAKLVVRVELEPFHDLEDRDSVFGFLETGFFE
jgi:hypothetical protein